jgi:two-component system NtrC family sensor kinase
LQTTRPDLLERVIFVTGDTVSASTRSFLEKTGRPVLAKPFEPERLLRMANQNLRATAR